jgi:hypothetical protein
MRRWLVCGLLAFAFLGVGDYFLFPFYGRTGPDPTGRQENGLWLRYTWYFGEYANSDLSQLAARLNDNSITSAYWHVRYIRADGTLKFQKSNSARKLLNRIRELAPNTRNLAWIYMGHGKLGDVDISKPEVRENIAIQAAWLVKECKFQGVQLDYEVCPDGDRNFLDLLERTRVALPEHAVLSVASPSWDPLGVGWTESYFSEVARRCDQIAVMGYDTGATFPRLYCWLMEQQVERVTAACGDTAVLLGLPTYDEGGASHNPQAEQLKIGLWGVRKGSARASAKLAGVALFADYTTDREEWKVFHDLWSQWSH